MLCSPPAGAAQHPHHRLHGDSGKPPCLTAGCMVMATNDSAHVADNLAAVSVSRASGAVLLAEAQRGAGVSAWAPSCVPPALPLCSGPTHLVCNCMSALSISAYQHY
jgi:hypothetical protein